MYQQSVAVEALVDEEALVTRRDLDGSKATISSDRLQHAARRRTARVGKGTEWTTSERQRNPQDYTESIDKLISL